MSDLKNDYLGGEETLDIRELFSKLSRRKWIIISLAVICVILSLIYSFRLQPVYRATATLLIEIRPPRIMEFEDVAIAEHRDIARHLSSQIEILRSHFLAQLVYERLSGYEPWDRWKGRKTTAGASLGKEERVSALLANVEIEPVRGTSLIEISVKDIDPKLAAKIANAWVDAYISQDLESRASLTRQASDWLEEEIERAKGRLKRAEAALHDYARVHQITEASLKEAEEAALLNQAIHRKAQLEVELAQQLKYYREKHPVIIGIRSELKSLQDKIATEKERLLALKEKATTFNILQREVETSQALYESLLARFKEVTSIEHLRASTIRIVDPARPPDSPIYPRKKLNLMVALFLGLALGGGIAFFFESLDQTIKTPEDMQKFLSLPFLGLIPFFALKDKEFPPELVAFKDPHSPTAEGYRALRTSITFASPDQKKKALLVTSAVPKEGKTITAINLAISLSQAGEKTILVEADYRHPSLHNIFGISRAEGITEFLTGPGDNLNSYIHSTEIANLDLVTCGSIPPNPSELLGSKSMERLIGQLSEIYDRIIFDAPPVLAVTDAVILSTKVDGTIIIVKADETPRKAVLRTSELVASVGSEIIGAVLNMARLEKHKGYYYYHYYGHPREKEKIVNA